MIERPNSKAVDRKARLALPAAPPPVRRAAERVGDFAEVHGEWDLATAMSEARRCIQCPAAPCVKACPVGNDIPYALWLLEHGDVEAAARVFRATSTMPDICGRVCPQSVLCEGACPHARMDRPTVPIGRLEAFVTDRTPPPAPPLRAASGHRAAVVGAGPAGLTVAEDLARRGHAVTVLDALPAAGGVLRYGIPTFKLDHDRVRRHVERLGALGVRFVADTVVGRDLTVDDLFDEGFESVFLGTGAGVPRRPDIEGVELPGIQQATPFLVRANAGPDLWPPGLGAPVDAADRRVAVIGGGDTAMDCVRTALRLGAGRATCWYRRTEAEMPGNERDRALAREEGAAFEWLVQPVRFEAGADGAVASMTCVRMELGDADASGRRSPLPIPGSEFSVAVDSVVLALGYAPDAGLPGSVRGLESDERGRIRTDERTGATTREGVFSGGDAVLGPALVVHAVAHGLRAARAMHRFMTAAPAHASSRWT